MEKKLTPDQIRAIRQDDRSLRKVAQDFLISKDTVRAIRAWQIYRDVPDFPELPPNSYTVGDCLPLMRELPAGVVKGVITSPPYNKGIMAKSGTSAWVNYDDLASGYAGYDDARSAIEYILWQREFITEALRLVGQDGAVFYQTKFQIQDGLKDPRWAILNGFPLRQIVIWNRSGSHNAGGYEPTILAPCYEAIYILAGPNWVVPKGQARNEARKWQDLWTIKPEGKDTTGHPASFPVELARRCVLLAGGPVLDPFAGSGTVGIAAERLTADHPDHPIPYYLFDLSPEYKDLFEQRREGERANRLVG